MTYIEKRLIGANEEIKVKAKISHLIYALLILCMVILPCGIIYLGIPNGVAAITFIAFAYILVGFLFTEYVITNKKAVKKTGVIRINTNELKNNKIESININQGIIGRIFRFGSVVFTGTGNKTIVMKWVGNPSKIKREIEDLIFEEKINDQ